MYVGETRITDISQATNILVSALVQIIICTLIKQLVAVQIQMESGEYVFILIAKSVVTRKLLCEVSQNDYLLFKTLVMKSLYMHGFHPGIEM